MSMPPVIHYLQFDALSEPWVTYNLSDQSKLRLKTVVVNIIKTGQYDEFGKPVYGVMSNTIQVVRAPKELRGNPTNPMPTPQQINDSIIEDVNSSVENDEWNTYRCEDGTTINLKVIIVSIKRTSKVDPLGEPIYMVSTQNMIKDEVPKILYKKS